MGFVVPCLTLSYLGQGARIISDGPDVLENVFYRTVPGGIGQPFYWITFVSALMATVSLSA